MGGARRHLAGRRAPRRARHAPVEAVRYTDGRVERIPDVPSRFQLTNVEPGRRLRRGRRERSAAGCTATAGSPRLELPKGATAVSLIDINEAGDVLGTVDPADAARGLRRSCGPAAGPDRPRVLDTPAGLSVAGVRDRLGRHRRRRGVRAVTAVTPYLWHPDGAGEPLPVPAELGQDGRGHRPDRRLGGRPRRAVEHPHRPGRRDQGPGRVRVSSTCTAGSTATPTPTSTGRWSGSTAPSTRYRSRSTAEQGAVPAPSGTTAGSCSASRPRAPGCAGTARRCGPRSTRSRCPRPTVRARTGRGAGTCRA